MDIKCSCGGNITKTIHNIEWKDYRILNVPLLFCLKCYEERYPSNVQIRVSMLADEMRANDVKVMDYE